MLVSLLIIWSFIIRIIHFTYNTPYDSKKLIKKFWSEFQCKIAYEKICLGELLAGINWKQLKSSKTYARIKWLEKRGNNDFLWWEFLAMFSNLNALMRR